MRRRSADSKRRNLAREVRQMPLTELVERFHEQRVQHAFVVCENGQLTLSHPKLLEPLKAFLELSNDFAGHEGVFIGTEPGLPTLFFAFVHDTRRGLSQGGLRYRGYDTVAQVVEDGLRLSQGMTRKNALGGLWWGGGKGILPMTPAMQTPEYKTENTPRRREIFQAYARFVASLGGLYYTAEDVGTKTSDMDAMLAQNRFQTCISDRFGGSGNPSSATARGVFWSMQAAWRFLTGSDRLAGTRVAVQGAGNVGGVLVRLLDAAGAEVWTCDLHQPTLDQLRQERPRVHIVSPDEILSLDVDILAPCAIGDQVNVTTIPQIRARLICGAANNILGEPADAERLKDLGILFVPDYVCNRMGIINCADEWQGYLADDVQIAAQRLYPDTLRILKHARNLVITTTAAADELAEIAASELHPQIGHRGRRIIDHLIASGWHRVGQDGRGQGGAGQDGRRRESVPEPAFVPSLHEPELRLLWNHSRRLEADGKAGVSGTAGKAGVSRTDGKAVVDGKAGASRAIAATPVSTASRPSLDGCLSALLMDVRARALETETGEPCRRVAGAEHGGLSLQLAVERSFPYDRDEIGRDQLFEACEDLHNRNDSAVREQLKRLGVEFDPTRWIDPMGPSGADVVSRLFHALDDAGLVDRQQRLGFHCPRCSTVLVSSEIRPTRVKVRRRTTLRFPLADGPAAPIEAHAFFPELLVGTVAVAVRPQGPYGSTVGRRVLHPLNGRELPVLGVETLETDAAYLVPAFSSTDAAMAQEAGLQEIPPVFDKTGRVVFPDGTALERSEARRRILETLGARGATTVDGDWTVDARRCRRCETLVVPSHSEQVLLHLERAAGALEQAVRSGAVTFDHPAWEKKVLRHLEMLEPICISRQQWWGNSLPGHGSEVLSTWFSMIAGAMEGAGWPANGMLRPVDELYVDAERLLPWVVPSQLVALALTGRPAFRRIVVHGTVHLVDRDLVPIPGVPADAPDEERFLMRTRLRPMRKQLGNVVEPASLIRRFGADALRLGLLLCLRGGAPEVVTLAESALRRARRTLHRFVAQVGGLQRAAAAAPAGSPTLLDHWLIARCTAAANEVRAALAVSATGDAARIFVDLVEDLRRFGRLRGTASEDGPSPWAGFDTGVLGSALAPLWHAFAPLCPFALAKLETWAADKDLAEDEGLVSGADPELPPMVRALQRHRGRSCTLTAGSPDLHGLVIAHLPTLERLTGARIRLAPSPDPRGGTRVTRDEPVEGKAGADVA